MTQKFQRSLIFNVSVKVSWSYIYLADVEIRALTAVCDPEAEAGDALVGDARSGVEGASGTRPGEAAAAAAAAGVGGRVRVVHDDDGVLARLAATFKEGL